MAAALFAAELNKQKGGCGSDMKTYERMKNLGLPMNSILNKMRMDGCDQKAIEKCGGKTAKKAQPVQDEKQIMPLSAQPTKKMKPFHWAKLNKNKSSSVATIWDNCEAILPTLCNKINFQQLESQFNKEADLPIQKQQKAKQKKRATQLIDPKRAQNVMMGLAQMKMTEDNLLDAILKMDDKLLGLNKLRKLLRYVPTDGELTIVREYVMNGGNVNDLSKVEQFFVKMMDMAAIRKRLELWIFKLEFPSILEDVQRRLTMVSQTIDTLIDNERLKKVLYFILVVGNHLNYGSSRGNAFGFSMEPTLELLDSTRASDKKTRLILKIVEIIDSVDKDALLWISDCEMLEKTYKCKTNSILNDLDAIKRYMNAIGYSHRRKNAKCAQSLYKYTAQNEVSVNQLAEYIRKLSKSGPQALFNGCETYAGLKFSFGEFGKITPFFQLKEKQQDDEEKNAFGKVMFLFHKKQKSKVLEVERFFKRIQGNVKTLSTYFGFEEDKKWEEIFFVFHLFREQFTKALRELQMKRQKEERIRNQNEKRDQLAAKLAHQPKTTNDSDESKSTRSSQKVKASAMYAAFKKSQKGRTAHSKILDV